MDGSLEFIGVPSPDFLKFASTRPPITQDLHRSSLSPQCSSASAPPSLAAPCYPGGKEIQPMSATATAPTHRAAINRANSQRSTGPRSEAGKQRAKLNAIKHGLTAQNPVLPTEDLVAFNRHVQQFLDEYHPAAPPKPILSTTSPTSPGARTASRSSKPASSTTPPLPSSWSSPSPRSASTASASPASSRRRSTSSAPASPPKPPPSPAFHPTLPIEPPPKRSVEDPRPSFYFALAGIVLGLC